MRPAPGVPEPAGITPDEPPQALSASVALGGFGTFDAVEKG